MKNMCIKTLSRVVIGIIAFPMMAMAGPTKNLLKISSPNGRITVEIAIGNQITYSINYNGKKYITPSPIGITLHNGLVMGQNPHLKSSFLQSIRNTVVPAYGISSTIKDNYNEIKLIFKDGYNVIFRAYDEGIAYRFQSMIRDSITIVKECNEFHFSGNYPVYFHPALSEATYRLQNISEQPKPNYSSLPILAKATGGPDILIHEADVIDYPCLTLKSDSLQPNTLIGISSQYPVDTEPGGYSNFNLIVKSTEPFIAKTNGTRNFPWRLIAFANQDKDILNNQLVYLLASESKLGNTNWIKPGKVSWDWWNSLNLSGVSFQTGFNTESYKYYIDFAAKNHIEYVNLDEGWSDQYNLLKVTDKLDMQELIAYAKDKHVGLVLWCVWRTLDRQLSEAMEQFQKWGIAGLKVDFMDRDDQIVVRSQERILQEAAKRKMLVNFHGAYHPTGMVRTYPNNINVEGVHGLEWDKFNPEGTTPVHDLMIPFIRMFAGSMDYTPGAMGNYNQKDWRQIFDRPVSQGTRCHQLAMYVVYYAPLQMLADAPTTYEKEPRILHFLSDVPTVWDETVPLEGEVGKCVAVARRKGKDWYIGAMGNWEPQVLKLKLDFLGTFKYDAKTYADGPNAARVGSDYTYEEAVVSSGDQIIVNLGPGGGWVTKLSPRLNN